VAIFYAAFIALLIGEGALARAITALAAVVGAGPEGPFIAWALFVVGGCLLGMFELRAFSTERPLRDPILRLCCSLQRRFGVAGFLVNAAVLGGAPGTAVALKKAGRPHPAAKTFLAAVVFATVWIPLYLWIWS
jgi:hypothetical protein